MLVSRPHSKHARCCQTIYHEQFRLFQDCLKDSHLKREPEFIVVVLVGYFSFKFIFKSTALVWSSFLAIFCKCTSFQMKVSYELITAREFKMHAVIYDKNKQRPEIFYRQRTASGSSNSLFHCSLTWIRSKHQSCR